MSHLRVILVMLLVGALPLYAETESNTMPSVPEESDLDEISRQLDNPLTSLWSLTFENKTSSKTGDLIDGTEWGNAFNFQPGMPIPLGEHKEWVFISRPVFPVVTNPILDSGSPSGVNGHVTGLGDIQMLSMVGPNRKDGIVWGAGATFKFPTATDDALGQDQYQAGPAAMLFNISKPWIAGALVQHWWSYAGRSGAARTSQTDIQYVIRYSLPAAWSIGMGPTISINWEAASNDQLTLPIGLGVTKTVRFGKTPVKFRLESHYSVIKPDSYGNEWAFIFRFAPVIRSPFQ